MCVCAAGGQLYCMYYMQDTSSTDTIYVYLYNDDTTVDYSTNYRFTCVVSIGFPFMFFSTSFIIHRRRPHSPHPPHHHHQHCRFILLVHDNRYLWFTKLVVAVEAVTMVGVYLPCIYSRHMTGTVNDSDLYYCILTCNVFRSLISSFVY